ncbi:YgcG family protein [Comamonas testosteroni]|uniref:YgcG family protein n=1 Tax=Comamonas testosteroni TaxID=285 RepID=A0A373FBA1_COMTE|nr:YgcG family protein [Comamonas testosteroni]
MQKRPSVLIFNALTAIVFAWLCLLTTVPAWAQSSAGTPPPSQLQPVPALTGRVIDTSGTLGSGDVQALSQQLEQLEADTGAQLVVLMVPSTAPEDIAAYAWRVASEWKLGRKDIGDGALIVVAKDERRMRIEVARKLEGAIPDIQAARIMDETMQPRFKAGDYAGGLSAAIDRLALLIKGEQLPAPEPSESASPSSFGVTLVALFWLLGAPAARWMLGRFKASLLVGAATGVAVFVMERSLQIALGAAVIGMLITLLGWFRLLSGGRGGGRGGKGGGFRSGGGGRFGGGGASGGW